MVDENVGGAQKDCLAEEEWPGLADNSVHCPHA